MLRKQRGPMMYIKQPKFGPGSPKMQNTFTQKPREGKKPNQGNQEIVKKPLKSVRTESDASDRMYQEPEQGQHVNEKQNEAAHAGSATENRKKRFKDMTVEEKIDYLLNLPSAMPPVKCEIHMEKEKHRGVIAGFEDGVVTIRRIVRPHRIKVDVGDIKDIKRVSF